MAKVVYQKKTTSGYIPTYEHEGDEVWKDLAHEPIAKKLEACSYIRSIKRQQNYDGTNTIIVSYAADCGGGRRIYTVER